MSVLPSDNLGPSANIDQSELPKPDSDQSFTVVSNFAAQNKNKEPEFSLTPPSSPGSDLSDNLAQSSVIFDLSQGNSHLDISAEVTMNMEDLAKLLTQQNGNLQRIVRNKFLRRFLKRSKWHVTLAFPGNNSIPMPRFSGGAHEDVNEFLTNFNRTAAFYHLSSERKAEGLPLFLTGRAGIWFNTTPELKGRSFDILSHALKKQRLAT